MMIPSTRRFCLSVFLAIFVMFTPVSRAASAVAVTGWAWSDNIGWISLNCSDLGTCNSVSYGFEYDTEGRISGYAWSDHVGWISAQTADLVGCPVGACELAVSDNGTVSGWIKILNAQHGWDGWISMRGNGYGTHHVSNGTITGWGWGDAVTGWVLFSANQPCADTTGVFCDGNALKYRAPDCSITVVTSDCGPGGCSQLNNQCIVAEPPSPPITRLPGGVALRAAPSLLQPGRTSTLTWNIENATSCSVTGNGDVWSGVAGERVTSPIYTQVRYTLSCSGPGGLFDASAIIKVVPSIREI